LSVRNPLNGIKEISMDQWLKVRIHSEGTRLVATCYTTSLATGSHIFRFEVDTKPIYDYLVRKHMAAHQARIAGCPDCPEVGFSFGGLVNSAVKLGKTALYNTASAGISSGINVAKAITSGNITGILPALAGANKPMLDALNSAFNLPVTLARATGSSSLTTAASTLAKAPGLVTGALPFLGPASGSGSIARNAGNIASKASSVVSSPIVAAGAVALAAATPIGVPALAAYASANLALKYLSDGNAATAAARSLAAKASSVGRYLGLVKTSSNGAKAFFAAHPQHAKAAAEAVAAKKRLDAIRANPALVAAAKRIAERRVKAVRLTQSIQSALHGSDPQKRAEASKAAAVLHIAQQAREQVAAIHKRVQIRQGLRARKSRVSPTKASAVRPLPGITRDAILISKRGVRTGKWRPAPVGSSGSTKGLLLLPDGRRDMGSYVKVGGCVGCGSIVGF
jgi:hypothetical protein